PARARFLVFPMNFSLPHTWFLVAGAALLVVWAGSLVAVRLWTRHQVIKALRRQIAGPEEVRIALPDPGPQDLAALELIRSYRRRYLLKLWPGTTISFKAINEMSQELIREIARVYHPDEARPELKASLADLVALHNRVGVRLAAWLESRPLRPFKDVELATVLKYHEIYRGLKNHWSYALIKRHHLDQVAVWGWSAFNYANPWHWGRKAAFHGGKELAIRLLMAQIAELVGEEAVRIYGQRRPEGKRTGTAPAAAQPAVSPASNS
ncbi:MAG TPA: hypothetical protein VE082_08230, partial [Desulfobaccales bacterium]|nr:hypothetical protein [Desulfobaccales bacterium]